MSNNLNQTSTDLVYSLINAANPSLPNGALSATNATLGNPTATGATPNTSVAVTAIAGQGYSGSVTVTYNRLDITALFTAWGSLPVSIPSGASYTTASSLLPYLNTTYNIDLQDADIVTGAISAGSYPYVYTLVMNPNSLAYTGSLQVTLAA